jgi:hypothetical protein
VKGSILKWELTGIAVITVLGSFLHFVFELSGEWPPVGIIGAVNESVWEHFKIGYWPALFYALFEYKYLKGRTNNFFIAKAIGIYAIPVTIAVLFYSYTAIFGTEILAVDILIFVIAIAVGQMVSYRLLISHPLSPWSAPLGIFLIAALGIGFAVFTFLPPHVPLFQDANTGGYGIP